jgi:hypothetical protein
MYAVVTVSSGRATRPEGGDPWGQPVSADGEPLDVPEARELLSGMKR